MQKFEDQTRTCSDCHVEYKWDVKDQLFAERNGWLPPKRCPRCREIRKQRRHANT